ncbi:MULTISPECIES: TetR/AcrR family transcriptional regulator [Aquitalea]|uniref:TetR family transcriptional regulator n=1 Tax=Aquitalea magnusonii TaxID=332411 RepID=A0A318JAE9_9NEIS|nr:MULTISPECIES: TetR/AcrR family transcriptional regulator [Aquitalea]PXX44331.1 TetR family transcriptional regulator [Aquitalea magnusonii]
MNIDSVKSMTENCPIARWRRKKEARPAEILDAALSQFVEKGYRATKMEDIARAAGVTKGTPYLYFQNKEEIFKAIARGTFVANLQQLDRLADDFDGSASALLHQMVAHWWQEVGCSPSAGLCKLMIAEAANFPELARFYFEELIAPSNQLLSRVLQRGIDSGEFRAVPLVHTVDALLAPLLTTMIFSHSFGQLPGCCIGSTKDPLGFLQDALDLVLHGLKNN